MIEHRAHTRVTIHIVRRGKNREEDGPDSRDECRAATLAQRIAMLRACEIDA
jgi:hypothetical protein